MVRDIEAYKGDIISRDTDVKWVSLYFPVSEIYINELIRCGEKRELDETRLRLLTEVLEGRLDALKLSEIPDLIPKILLSIVTFVLTVVISITSYYEPPFIFLPVLIVALDVYLIGFWTTEKKRLRIKLELLSRKVYCVYALKTGRKMWRRYFERSGKTAQWVENYYVQCAGCDFALYLPKDQYDAVYPDEEFLIAVFDIKGKKYVEFIGSVREPDA
jgi:hypothetical protein